MAVPDFQSRISNALLGIALGYRDELDIDILEETGPLTEHQLGDDVIDFF